MRKKRKEQIREQMEKKKAEIELKKWREEQEQGFTTWVQKKELQRLKELT